MNNADLIRHLPKSLLTLVILNFISAIMHIVFQFYLAKVSGVYHEFLLIENLLISFVFLYFSLGLFFGSNDQKRTLLIFQLSWWLAFLLLVIFYWGAVSTLSIFEEWLHLPESLILAITGLSGVILSILSLSDGRRESE